MFEYKFKCNGTNAILNIENNYIRIGEKEMKLKSCELKSRKKIYYKITNDCNLNCVYCFQRYDNKDIKNIKIGEYSKIISKHIDDKENEIIIFGGEPFIDKNIENLQYLFDVANMKNKLSFFTNGCYSIKIDELIKNNKSSINHLTITLDGPERIHNNRRIFVGNNSYRTIIKNLLELQKEKIPFVIQVNVDSKNIDSIEELLDNLDCELGLQNIEIGLNKVLRDKSTINELELLKKYVNLISKYNNANLDINSKVYENISVYISGSGYNKSRCGIGDTTMIFDFLTNKIYSCPQEVNTEIGYFTNDTIKIDDVKKYEMCSVSNKNNAICSQCEYTKFCSFGCYLEKNNMHANCKDETEKVIKYIFENFETLFLSEEK